MVSDVITELLSQMISKTMKTIIDNLLPDTLKQYKPQEYLQSFYDYYSN